MRQASAEGKAQETWVLISAINSDIVTLGEPFVLFGP